MMLKVWNKLIILPGLQKIIYVPNESGMLYLADVYSKY